MNTQPTQLHVRVGRYLVPVTRDQIASARSASGKEIGADYSALVGDESGLTVLNDIMSAEEFKALSKP